MAEAEAVALILGHVSLVVLLLLLPRGPDFIASERETLLQTISTSRAPIAYRARGDAGRPRAFEGDAHD